jgi:CDP-diacylglycerol--glycerol-3-phosphate 3-phosphatidyltransferase
MALSFVWGGLIAYWRFERWPLVGMPAVLFVRMALNAIDGMLAREHGMKSSLGAILNELGDILSDAALFLPLAVVPEFAPELIVSLVVLAGAAETAGIIGVQIGASRRYDGPMGKSDRAAVVGGLCLAVGLGAPGGWWLGAVLSTALVLLALTIVNRCFGALRELRG